MHYSRSGWSALVSSLALTFFLFVSMTHRSHAQSPRVSPGDTLTSAVIRTDGRVILRIYAPKAADVKIGGTDIPDEFRKNPMTKLADGVWEANIGPLDPGSYRYTFMIDNVPVVDPKNPSTSESNMNTWSLFHVPGAAFMDTKEVPHGAISQVTYYSTSLGRSRRMHVYTPPGYESGKGQYPVLYLLHGAFDCDNSWPTVGRAGFILDNLIADQKAVPMVVVMPAGHTGPFSFGNPKGGSNERPADLFIDDFVKEIKPYIESHYRILPGRAHRAIAGLSMGGLHTLAIAIPNLHEYSALGVFSSGIFELNGQPKTAQAGPSWEERNAQALDLPEWKKGLDLVWFATGRRDFLLTVSRNTVEMLKKHGFNVEYHETAGGHTWANWREYLHAFAPRLFTAGKH